MQIVRRCRQRCVKLIWALIVVSVAAPIGLVAISLGLRLAPLPYELFVVWQRLPIVFPLHMIASGVALILIPIAVFVRRWALAHRMAGGLAAAAVSLGALSALPVALASEAQAMGRIGFLAQGVVWLLLLAAGLTAIWRGDTVRHVRCMLAMAAVASGAIWLRLVLVAVNAAHVPFAPAYSVASWICWLVPLCFAVALSKRPRIDGVLRQPFAT